MNSSNIYTESKLRKKRNREKKKLKMRSKNALVDFLWNRIRDYNGTTKVGRKKVF